MGISSILKLFVPRNTRFFDLFDGIAQNLGQIGTLMREMVTEPDFDARTAIIARMQKVEELNDMLTQQLLSELAQNFITPFDREDIHALAEALDDIADFTYNSARKINLYRVNPSDSGIQKIAVLIEQSTVQVAEAVRRLRNIKDRAPLRESLIRISDLENQTDDVVDLCVEQLFSQEPDAKVVMKMREIYETMEEATDRCEEVSRVIDSILIKYA